MDMNVIKILTRVHRGINTTDNSLDIVYALERIDMPDRTYSLNAITQKCYTCDGHGKRTIQIDTTTAVKLAIMLTDSRHRKIEAVKYLREHYDINLSEAATYIKQTIIPLVETVEDTLGNVE